MNTLPEPGTGDDAGGVGGAKDDGAAFDAEHVYRQLQDACRSLEQAEQHATAAYVAHAMAMVHDRYHVGHDHRDGD